MGLTLLGYNPFLLSVVWKMGLTQSHIGIVGSLFSFFFFLIFSFINFLSRFILVSIYIFYCYRTIYINIFKLYS
jgi:hypothetical protein